MNHFLLIFIGSGLGAVVRYALSLNMHTSESKMPYGILTCNLLGCLIIGVLNNGLFLLNVSPFWQQIIKGFVILAAVAIDKMNQRKS